MACRGALFSTKWLIFSLMSKMMTIPMMRRRAIKKVRMNFFMMYQSIFFSPTFIFLKS